MAARIARISLGDLPLFLILLLIQP
jgi:hypothetical protein